VAHHLTMLLDGESLMRPGCDVGALSRIRPRTQLRWVRVPVFRRDGRRRVPQCREACNDV